MLLVVAIISLLIAILLPSLGQSKHVAQTTICKSNLNHIYSATLLYTQDSRNYLPASRAWVGGDWSNINSVRNGTLYKYMGGNESAYKCPVFVSSPRNWWTTSYGGQNYQTKTTIAFTYSLNEWVGNDWGGNILRTLRRIEEPDKLGLYTDENPWMIPGYSTHPINNGAMGVGGWGPAGGDVDCIGSYHYPPNGNLWDGKSNVLYVDGHVDLQHVSQTKPIIIAKRFRPAGS